MCVYYSTVQRPPAMNLLNRLHVPCHATSCAPVGQLVEREHVSVVVHIVHILRRDVVLRDVPRVEPAPQRLVPESVELKFSAKVSGLSVYMFISQCKYFATLNTI